MKKKKILIVDDVDINRDILAEILNDQFEPIEAKNGREALDILHASRTLPAIVLLDLIMPVMDGFQTLEVLREEDYLSRMPVLVITGETDGAIEKQCLEYGIADFVRKPFDPILVKCRVSNAVELYSYKNSLEDQVRAQTRTLRRQNRELHKQASILERYNQTIVDILGTVVESRNLESGDHIQRVKGYTRIMAECMQTLFPEKRLTDDYIEIIVSASALHDVGKIAIPDQILLKPGRLTPEEFTEMKKHTTLGCELLESIEGAWSEEYKKVCIEICRSHHERYDGRGYPDALQGDDIPLPAQLVSVADVYDALVSKRCYKDAYAREQAYDMILNGECGTFAPAILDCFRKSRKAFEALAIRNA